MEYQRPPPSQFLLLLRLAGFSLFRIFPANQLMENNVTGTDAFLTRLRLLNQIGASILSEFTIPQIIDTVYQHVNLLMDASSFAIGIYNPISERIEYTGTRENEIILPDFSVAANNDDRFSGWVFSHHSTILINDYESEYHLYLPKTISALYGMEPSSLMYVPIFIDKTIAGILSVRTKEKSAYTSESLEILNILSVFIAKAIENARAVKKNPKTFQKLPKSYYLDPLSAREIEVLNLLSKGNTNRTIAADLFISPSTVKTHTLNIYMKLQVANRTEAIVKAKEYGLIN